MSQDKFRPIPLPTQMIKTYMDMFSSIILMQSVGKGDTFTFIMEPLTSYSLHSYTTRPQTSSKGTGLRAPTRLKPTQPTLELPTYVMQHGILSIWVKSIIWAVKNILLSIKSKKINWLLLSMLSLPCCTGHWALYYGPGGLHPFYFISQYINIRLIRKMSHVMS